MILLLLTYVNQYSPPALGAPYTGMHECTHLHHTHHAVPFTTHSTLMAKLIENGIDVS